MAGSAIIGGEISGSVFAREQG